MTDKPPHAPEFLSQRVQAGVIRGVQVVNLHSEALIARLKLEIEKLKREIHGHRLERKARLLEQLELQLEELEADCRPG